MKPIEPMIGILLAGGGAYRLGGGDKGLLRVGDRPILERVLGVLRPHCAEVVISANGDPARFAAYGSPVVPDRDEARLGPLAGVSAALDAIAARWPEAAFAVTAPTDAPFLPPDLVPRLAQARAAAGTPLACAVSGGRRHPVAALWSLALRDELRAVLAGGLRKAGAVFDRHPTAFVEWPSIPVDPFANVNTSDDLAAADAIARDYRLAADRPQRL